MKNILFYGILRPFGNQKRDKTPFPRLFSVEKNPDDTFKLSFSSGVLKNPTEYAGKDKEIKKIIENKCFVQHEEFETEISKELYELFDFNTTLDTEKVIFYKYDIDNQKIVFLSENNGKNTLNTAFFQYFNPEKDDFSNLVEIKTIEVFEDFIPTDFKFDFSYSYYEEAEDRDIIGDCLFYSYKNPNTNNFVAKAFGNTFSGDTGTSETVNLKQIPIEKALKLVLKQNVIHDEIKEDIDLSEAEVFKIRKQLEIPKNLSMDLYNDIISVLERQRSIDSFTDMTETIEEFITSDGKIHKFHQLNASLNTFTLSDKTYFTIKGQVEAFCVIHSSIPIAKTVYNQIDHQRVYKSNRAFTVYDQILAHRPFLHVYVNGVKVRDDECKFYLLEDSTDIFIPARYIFKEKPNSFIIERKYDLNSRYFTTLIDFSDKPGFVYNENEGIPFDINKPSHGFKFYNKADYYQNGQYVEVRKNEEDYKGLLNDKTISCYLDGYFIPDVHYDNMKKALFFDISVYDPEKSLSTLFAGKRLEVIIDSSICSKSKIYEKEPRDLTKYAFFMPEEEYINTKHGPISKSNCLFYISSKTIDRKLEKNTLKEKINLEIDEGYIGFIKVSPNKVRQIARSNFEMEIPLKNTTHKTVLMISDTNTYIKETSKTIFAEDYYISNLLNVCGISELLSDIEPITDDSREIERKKRLKEFLKQDFVNDVELARLKYGLYRNSPDSNVTTRYTKENFNLITKIIKNSTDNYAISKELIRFRPYLIRKVLENYGKNEVIKEFNEIPTSGFFEITQNIPPCVEEGKTNFYSVTINGYYISKKCYDIVNMQKYELIRVNIEKVKAINPLIIKENDKNYVTLRFELAPFEKYNSFEIKPTQISFDKDKKQYCVVFPTLKTIQDEEDYEVFIRSYKEQNIFYPDDTTKSGWLQLKGCTFHINKTDQNEGDVLVGCTKIFFDKKPKKRILIGSKRFKFAFSKIFSDDDDNFLNKIIIPIKVNNEFIPLLPKYGYNVYLNGNRLFEFTDYVFKTPSNCDMISFSAIILKIEIKKGDILTILFNGLENKHLGSKVEYFVNDYGLLYLDKLEFPFDFKYIDLYCNGRYILPHEIEILSDKLIRLPKELQPFNEVSVSTAFNVDISLLKEFIGIYKNYMEKTKIKPIEFKLEEWFNRFSVNASETDIFNDKYKPDNEKKYKTRSFTNKLINLFSPNLTDYNNLIESRDENMGFIEKKILKPNPIRKDKDYQVRSRYNPLLYVYLKWLQSTNTRAHIRPNKLLPKEIWDYFKLFADSNDVHSININPAKFNLPEKINLTYAKYSKSFGKEMNLNDRHTITMVLLYSAIHGIPLNKEFYKKFMQDVSADSLIYAEDLPRNISPFTLVDGPPGSFIRIGRKPRPENSGFYVIPE